MKPIPKDLIERAAGVLIVLVLAIGTIYSFSQSKHPIIDFINYCFQGELLQPAPTDEQRVHNLADKWRDTYKDEDGLTLVKRPDVGPGDYAELKQVLEMDDAPGAEAAVRELAKHKAADTIRKYFKTLPDRMWQIAGSKKLEKAFLATLNPEQRATYDRAIENRKKTSAKFDEFFGGKKLDAFYAKESPVQENNEQEPRGAGGEVPIERIVVDKSTKPGDVLVWIPVAGAHVNGDLSPMMSLLRVPDYQYSHYIVRGKPDGIELANLPDSPDENAEFHYHGIYVGKETADTIIRNAAVVIDIPGYTKTLRRSPEGLVQDVAFEPPALLEVEIWNRGSSGVIEVEASEDTDDGKIAQSWRKEEAFLSDQVAKIALQVTGVHAKGTISLTVRSKSGKSDTADYDFDQHDWSR